MNLDETQVMTLSSRQDENPRKWNGGSAKRLQRQRQVFFFVASFARRRGESSTSPLGHSAYKPQVQPNPDATSIKINLN